MSRESRIGETRRLQTRQLRLVIALSVGTLLVEVAGGLLSGSLALLSDAGHVLTDVLALVLSLMAVRFSTLPATPAKTYGYHRLEILTALLNGTMLIVISAGILYKSARRFVHPQPIESSLMLGVALVGLVANLVGVALLSKSPQNLNVRGARMHVISDALSSVGVVVAGGIIALTGWQRLDPIVGGAISLVIAFGSLRLVREAIDVLLEATPAGIDLDQVSLAIAAVPGVVEVHDLHIWSITTGLPALSGHVRLDGASPRTSSDDMLNRIKQTVRDRFGIVHTTIQIESRTYEELGDVH
jgi:cobalt-zinc-cadmium efflux system protein